VAGKVDAHCLRGDLVITDGLESAAIGGVDEQQDDSDADAREEEGHDRFQVQGDAAQRDGEAGKAGEAIQQVGAVGQGAKALVHHGGADDLRKAQCGNGKVVTLQFQHRQADEEGEQRGDETSQQQAKDNAQQKAQPAQRL